MTARPCPECARRAAEAEELERVFRLARELAPVILRKEGQARRLLAAGFDVEEISEFTGLRIEAIEEISNGRALACDFRKNGRS